MFKDKESSISSPQQGPLQNNNNNQMHNSLTDSIETRSSKSISDSSNSNNKRLSFDYSGCSMHCQLYIKGLLTKKKVNVYFNNNKLIIASEAYAKKPKRVIELGFYDLVKWHVQKSENQVTYTGMTLQTRKEGYDKIFEKVEEIEFVGDSMILEAVKDKLRRYIFQNRIQDEYIIQAQIGKGNYARVFSARHRATGNKIALKCFEKEKLRKSDNGYKALEKEIKIMQTIGSHPSLLEFIGSYEGENTFYVGMGLIEGNSLYHEIKKRKEEKFPLAQIKKYMKQIISGVQHYQQYGIMHRDLKPENIMFQKKEVLDQLVIVDFGLAEFEDSTNFLFNKCGTPGYVAPEVANYKEDSKNRYTIKCDMFSVGVILHALLYHSSVFYGKKFNEVLIKNKECNIDYTQKLYENTSAITIEFMKGLLEKDPEKRLSAADALKHEFFFEEGDDQEQSIRKKAGSWTVSIPDQIGSDNIQTVGQNGENEEQNKKNQRKRATTSQSQSQSMFKSNMQTHYNSSGQTQNESLAINSFNNVLSNDQISTSFYHNVHQMFQANNMTQSTAAKNFQNDNSKVFNMIDSNNIKLSIELGSSPQIQPANFKDNSSPNLQDMLNSNEKKQNLQLNRVLEVEEDNDSPDVRKKMKSQNKDYMMSGIKKELDKQKNTVISQAEKDLNDILKQQKSQHGNSHNEVKVSEQNESQEFDNSVDLDEQQGERFEDKMKEVFSYEINNLENQDNQ